MADERKVIVTYPRGVTFVLDPSRMAEGQYYPVLYGSMECLAVKKPDGRVDIFKSVPPNPRMRGDLQEIFDEEMEQPGLLLDVRLEYRGGKL